MVKKIRNKKVNVYAKEGTILENSEALAKDQAVSDHDKARNLEELCRHYEELLDQCKLITNVSDRLQKKINKANQQLEDKNLELQKTVSALTKARVGRKATTIVLFIAVILFVLEEWKVEPWLEEVTANNLSDGNTANYVSLGLKGLVALMLKPIEMLVERYMMKRARNKVVMLN